MPLRAGELGLDEHLCERHRVVDRVHAGPEAEHVRIVVQPGELGGLLAPGDRGPYPADLVGGHRLAVTRAANHNAEAARVVDGLVGRAHDVRRVVVVIALGVRAAVHRVVPGLLEPLDQAALQHETSMVGSKVDAHERQSVRTGRAGGRGWAVGVGGRGAGQSKIGSLVRVRFSSKKPSVPATARTPSQSLAAASPRGIGETTGPKKATPSTEITGVPTS